MHNKLVDVDVAVQLDLSDSSCPAPAANLSALMVLPALPKLDQPLPPVRPKSKLCARKFPVERGILRPFVTGGGCEFELNDDAVGGGEDDKGGDEERKLRFNDRKADSSWESRLDELECVMIGNGTVLVE